MSNYSVSTDFGNKDELLPGDAGKIIRGSEFSTEFNSIATAIATKADLAGNVSFLNQVSIPTLVLGTLSSGTIDGGSY